ncbi:MAG: hypothetical protein HC910_02835 [Spirulinaceae cyanobacterium SM2_1_0]|nr:hypothetical protein [Spirulinaceae cyanobacterium SM2_1_0]
MLLPVFPLLLLILALGNLYLYQRADHELSRVLTAGIAVACLVWGFVIAHWSIHLLCLLLLLKFRHLPFVSASSVLVSSRERL